MSIYEQGKAYWEVAKRYHTHRATSKAIGPTAVRDMQRLQQETRSKGVLRRINIFIAAHRRQLPGSSPNDDGPRFA